MSTLRAPATYKRISANSIRANAGSGDIIVRIEYDASNAYGVPIRDTHICTYPVGKDGQVNYFPSARSNIEAAAENAANQVYSETLNAFEKPSERKATENRPEESLKSPQPKFRQDDERSIYQEYEPSESELDARLPDDRNHF